MNRQIYVNRPKSWLYGVLSRLMDGRICTKFRKYRLTRDIYSYRGRIPHAINFIQAPSRLTTAMSVGTLNIVTNIPAVQEPSDSIYAPVINSNPFNRLPEGPILDYNYEYAPIFYTFSNIPAFSPSELNHCSLTPATCNVK